MTRYWDPQRLYASGPLKQYDFWELEVSYRQHTFGNFIVFCKREGVQAISELNDAEIVELKLVLKEIESALLANPVFQPIRFNYWQMGNKVRHLHFHGIPRYDRPHDFLGRSWVDPDPSKPPIWTYQNESDETVAAFREEMKKFLAL